MASVAQPNGLPANFLSVEDPKGDSERARLSVPEDEALSTQEDTDSSVESESAVSPEQRQWLVLDRVDTRGRRPLRPDAVLALALAGSFPTEGESVTGTSGTARWRVQGEDEGGRLSAENMGTAYRAFESPDERVVFVRLVGASTAIVNGQACAGDVYSYGWSTQLIRLHAGTNHVFVSGIRGGFRFSFEPVPNRLSIGTWDATLPDAILGEDQRLIVGLLVFHADPVRRASLIVSASVDGATVPAAQLGYPNLAPLSQRKLPISLDLAEPLSKAQVGDSIEVKIRLALFYDEGPADSRELVVETSVPIKVRAKDELQRRTFLSTQDLTAQEYCLRPPSGSPSMNEAAPGEPMRLLLSLHGAGVQAWSQAASYPALAGFWHVAATNRRPFGFDWQDWGRTDAYEVLDRALGITGVARRFVYLGGHSMGGHGTWHLGANDPDGFAALAPSAGWRSFDTYGGRPETELAWLWKQADAASNPEALVSNLAQIPTYILHGSADDNVPLSEAEAMFALLQEAGADPRMHVEPDKGHWWDAGVGPGVDCLAWPGFYELFRNNLIAKAPRTIDFTSVHPSVDSKHYWFHLLQCERYGETAHVHGTWIPEESRVELQLENVQRFRLEAPGWGSLKELHIGEQVLAFPARGQELVHTADGWRAENPPVAPDKRGTTTPGPPRKTPLAGGPFKRAFERNFLFVLPTECDPEEQAETLAVARYHQAVWRYRGNGDVALVRDVDLFPKDGDGDEVNMGRNLILFGNEETNAAWRQVVRGLADLRVRPGSIRVGPRTFEGEDLTCLAVLPGQRDPDQLIGLIATTGKPALALAPIQNLFVSGAGFPDYLVFSPAVLVEEDAGVLAAGWMDADWQLQTENSILR